MPSQTLQQDLSGANFTLADPGPSATLPGDQWGVLPLETSAAETRTMPDPAREGLLFTLYMRTDGGDCTVNFDSPYDEEGDNQIVFDDVGDIVVLYSIYDAASTLAWRMIHYDGVGGELPGVTLDDVTVDALTVNETLGVTGATTLSAALGVTGGATFSAGLTTEEDIGDTITQTTDINTAVTLDKERGEIVTVSATIAAGASETFTVNNSTVGADDYVHVQCQGTAGTGTPTALVSDVSAGSFDITIVNHHASAALNNTVTLRFFVINNTVI